MLGLLKSFSALAENDQNMIAMTLVASMIIFMAYCVDFIVRFRLNGK